MAEKVDPITDESAAFWRAGQDTVVASVPNDEVPCPVCTFLLEAVQVAVTDTGDLFWLMRCPIHGDYFEMEPVQ